jgi:putative oxidoreductase
MGIIFAVAGYSKLVGIGGTIEYFAKLGFPLPVITAWFIALLELGGGIALILGLFVRYLGFFMLSSLLWRHFGSSFLCRATARRVSI